MALITIRIAKLRLPEGIDAELLQRDVEHELQALLEREPIAHPRQTVAGGRVHAATNATLAHAIARHIHTDLRP